MPTKFIREKNAIVAVDTKADKKLKNNLKGNSQPIMALTVLQTEDFVFGCLNFYIKDDPRSKRFFQY